ncbi:MAG: RNA polymerase sigma factor [Nocardioides sp.]|uniref:RNA polymerase sigma factor n=1 Tax=Nocardioides sp. TaxID=35761 RepID=UPI0039E44524
MTLRPRGAQTEPTPENSDDFEAWVRPHWSTMRRLATRLVGPTDRDDVLQEALTAAWRTRRRYDPTRGESAAWLLGITAKCAANHRRTQERHRRHRSRTDLSESAVAPSTSVDIAARLDLDTAVKLLPRRQRLAVELVYFLGLSQDEAGLVMGCATGTVKSTLAAARRSLRDRWGDSDDAR